MLRIVADGPEVVAEVEVPHDRVGVFRTASSADADARRIIRSPRTGSPLDSETPARLARPYRGGLMDLDFVARLGDDLRAAGYDTEGVLGLLGDSAHRALARGEKVPALRATADGSTVSTLIRLFLLGGAVSGRGLAAALPTAGVAAAVANGVVEADGEDLRAGLDLRPYGDDDHEYLVFSDLDSDVRPGPVKPDHVLGIGAASLNLVRATIRERVDTVLDIGTGCGIQSLHAFHHAGRSPPPTPARGHWLLPPPPPA